MYGLSNQAEGSIRFEDSLFSENYGKTNTFHMLLSSLEIDNCDFTNNYAQYVTHGITLITSNLKISNSKIRFEKECHYGFDFGTVTFVKICSEYDDFFSRLKLEKLDTGFFNLYLTSYALITENTVIEDLLAQKQAVAYVIGKSRLDTSNNV